MNQGCPVCHGDGCDYEKCPSLQKKSYEPDWKPAPIKKPKKKGK